MGWSPDFTAPQMIISIKMSSYAFSCHDGWLLENGGKDAESLSERQKNYAVIRKPGLLEFLGWTYLVTGVLGGPAIEYRDYERFVDESMFSEVPGKKIPSCVFGSFKAMATALFFMGCIATFGFLSPDRLRHDVANSAVAATMPMWWMLFLVYSSSVFQRCKYYLVWLVGEASCDVSGVGFTGMVKSPDGKSPPRASWERSINVDPLGTETAQSLKAVIDSWNIATERWLRHYVYERLRFTPFKNWSRGLTFIVSAFWHGMYPGYYLTFTAAAIHREVGGSE